MITFHFIFQKNPLIYDALNLIANASIEFLSIKHSLARKSGLCPSKESQQDGRNLRQLAKMVSSNLTLLNFCFW